MSCTPLDVICPKCQAPRGERCRTLTTHRLTDCHQARWYAAFPDWPLCAPLRFGAS